MNMPTVSLAHLVAGAVSCLMAVIVALEVVPFGNEPTAAVDPPPARTADAGRAIVDATTFVKATLERPLFTPGRQPAEEPDEEDEDDDEDEAPSPLDVRLAGVFIGPDHSEALFDKDGDETVSVPEGGAIDGWTVDSIEMDRVVLSSASGEKVLLPTPVDPAAANAKRAAAVAKKRAIVNQGRAAAAQGAARNAPTKPAASARPKVPATQPASRAALPAPTKAAVAATAKPAAPTANARPILPVKGRAASQVATGRTGREP